MALIIILVVCFIFGFVLYKRSKKFNFDSVVMINGCVGGGKSSLSVSIGLRSIKKAHAIWWRRVHIWSIIYPNYKNDEEPFIYSNIPLYSNRKKGILHSLYKPLTNDILSRVERPNFKSVILIDESSLVATSLDYKDKDLSENLSLWLKLIRHELHGSYRNLFGSYPNVIVNTQSKNDNHYAFDRCMNQILYITKNINFFFFRIVYCRDLLVIDSVQNNFDDDVKESLSCRWFLLSKKVFNKYDSYAYSFLSDDFPISDKPVSIMNDRFEIATFHKWKEIIASNKALELSIKEYLKNKEEEEKEEGVVNNG